MRTSIEATLRKISSKHNNLSRDVYTGWVMPDALIIGQSFQMSTRESGLLWTTQVLTVRNVGVKDGKDITRFWTRNAEYELETPEVKQLEWKNEKV